MSRIGPSGGRPPDDLVAMEQAFESLTESTDIGHLDRYLEFRREILARFDRYAWRRGVGFGISEVLSSFANKLWTFAREAEAASQGTKLPSETALNAFEAFCRGGEVLFEDPGEVPSAEVKVGVADLLSLASKAKFQYLLINAKGIGVNLYGAANFLLDDTSEVERFSARLDGSRALAAEGDAKAVAELSELILGDGLVSHMARLSDAFEDRYFGPFMRNMGANATRAREAYEQGRVEEADGAVTVMKGLLSGMQDTFDSMRDVSMALGRTLKYLKDEVEDGDALALLNRHKPFMSHYSSVGHDYTGFLHSFMGFMGSVERDADKTEALIRFEDLCQRQGCSNILMLLELVKMKMNVFRLKADGMGEVEIPEALRRPLFRMVFNLVSNADKYRDPDKEETTIEVSAFAEGGKTTMVVEDNGVGIKDTRKVLEEGVRERPDLAKGYGLGLAGVVRMADENGLEFRLESELGVGTKATIVIGAHPGFGGVIRGGGDSDGSAAGTPDSELGAQTALTAGLNISQLAYSPLLAGAAALVGPACI